MLQKNKNQLESFFTKMRHANCMNEEIDLPKPMLLNWKKVALYVVPIALVAGTLVAKLGTKKAQSEKDFIEGATVFTKWNKVLDQNGPELAQLENIMKKHPELCAEYDTLLGQSLIAIIAPKQAMTYVNRALKRTNPPYYQEYSQTSLKITQGSFEEALQEALSLKEKMLLDQQYWERLDQSSALYAFNLLRIALLSQKIGNEASELSAWQEIKSYNPSAKKDNKIGQLGFKQLFTHFTVQEITLLDYIKIREEDLRKS
jgi:hypothetical protein